MKITKEEYYHALAIYIIASKKRRQVDELEIDLRKVLHIPDDDLGSHVQDAIYDYGNIGSQEEFDRVIELMGIKIDG